MSTKYNYTEKNLKEAVRIWNSAERPTMKVAATSLGITENEFYARIKRAQYRGMKVEPRLGKRVYKTSSVKSKAPEPSSLVSEREVKKKLLAEIIDKYKNSMPPEIKYLWEIYYNL